MLAQAEMLVVFVLSETISWGSASALTAKKPSKASAKVQYFLRCHSDDTLWKHKGGTGKPLERATQTLVGALFQRNSTEKETRNCR